MNFINILNQIIENKRRILVFLLLTLVSAFLIIAAINMLSFSHNSLSSSSSKNQKDQKNTKKAENNLQDIPTPREYSDLTSPGKGSNGEYYTQLPQNGYLNTPDANKPGEDGEQPGSEYSLPGDIDKKLDNKFPEFNIDLSQDGGFPGVPSFGNSGSYSLRSTQKARHAPLLEILGKLKVPLLKMMVQDKYSNSQWYAPDDKTYTIYKYEKKPDLSSVKIKPIEPSKGFIPVLSSMEGAKFPVAGVLKFPECGIFYTDFDIHSYYEIFYREPLPDEELLSYAEIDDTVTYNIENMDRTMDLANSIVKGVENPRLKLNAIENYLVNNYKYEAANNQTNPYGDAVNSFLFITKKGSQLDFVSAFVTLLRCAGIPARLVTGYKVNPGLDYQIVYSDQLCVYPEIKYKEYGWVALDKFTGDYSFNPPINTVTEITGLDTVAKKGQGFKVEGTVKDSDGNPVDGLPVLVYVKKTKDEECLSYFRGTVSNGKFEMECPIDSDVDVGNYHVVARTLASNKYQESWSDPILKVVADTSIKTSAPGFVLEGHEFNLNYTLYETLSNKPLEEKVNISFDRGIISQDNPKKENNTYKLKLAKGSSLNKDYFIFGKYEGRYTAEFQGSDLYLSSKSEGKINIWVIFWGRILILFTILLVLGIVTAFLILKRRKHNKTAVVKDFETSNRVILRNERIPPVIRKNNLVIVFPDILMPLPEVWGIYEELKVRFCDEYQNSDDICLTFDKKGEYRISTALSGEKSTIVSRNIRIVCYSEELIRLGKSLFKDLYGKYNLYGERMTPREIAGALSGKLNENLQDILYSIVSAFEKATYSLENVVRKDYERFFTLIFEFDNNLKEESK